MPISIFSCPAFMNYFARARISVFKDMKPNFQVKVKPNVNNQILLSVDLDYEKKTDAIDFDYKPVGCTKCCSCFGHCSRMDKKIVKLALCVLERIKVEKYEEIEKDLMNKRIHNIEESLEKITKKLDELLHKKPSEISSK